MNYLADRLQPIFRTGHFLGPLSLARWNHRKNFQIKDFVFVLYVFF